MSVKIPNVARNHQYVPHVMVASSANAVQRQGFAVLMIAIVWGVANLILEHVVRQVFIHLSVQKQ